MPDMKILRRLGNDHRLDEDRVSEFSADPQSGVANLANIGAVGAQQLDVLVLAEAQLPQPVAHLGRGRKMFDADHGPGFYPAKGTNLGARAVALQNYVWMHRFLHRAAKLD